MIRVQLSVNCEDTVFVRNEEISMWRKTGSQAWCVGRCVGIKHEAKAR